MRYLAYSLTGDGVNPFLMGDLPFSKVSYSSVLCGPDTFTGTLEPYYGDLRGVLVEGQTAVVALTDDNQVASACLVKTVTEQSDALVVTGVGVTAFLEAQPYRNFRAFIQADCGALLQHIWAEIQSYPDHNLGLTINPLVSGVKLGNKTVTAAAQEAKVKADKVLVAFDDAQVKKARDAWTAATKALSAAKSRASAAKKVADRKGATAAQKTTASSAARAVTDATLKANAMKMAYQRAVTVAANARARVKADTKAVQTAEQQIKASGQDDLKPYALSYFETHDLAQKFNEIADAGSIDYKTKNWIDADGNLKFSIVQDTRLGSRRSDVRLVVGENVIVAPDVARDSSSSFSDVLLVGAGEGAAALHAMSSHKPGRLGSTKVVVDQKITSQTVLKTRVEQIRSTASTGGTFSAFQVADNAQGIQLGDSVFLGFPVDSYAAGESRWVRITAITYTPDTGIYEFACVADS